MRTWEERRLEEVTIGEQQALPAGVEMELDVGGKRHRIHSIGPAASGTWRVRYHDPEGFVSMVRVEPDEPVWVAR